jgi:methylenetetrahydrofolate dehydrogenase (NADP+)/methenyltetrahydrofolate cyclohydrolase
MGRIVAKILDGKKCATKVRKELAREIKALNAKVERAPCLAVIWVGENPASATYVKAKGKACAEVNIDFRLHHLPETVTEKALLSLIKELNTNDATDAILVQLPLPKQISEKTVVETILPQKDVDGFHPYNLGRLLIGNPVFIPCTPAGILELLRQNEIETKGKDVVIIGRSNIVGKPIAVLLLQKTFGNATVTICHTATKDLISHTKQADILIVAAGQPKIIKTEMVKEGVVVIDVGIHRTKNGLCGDVDFANVYPKASAITPVPGGVGPLTVAMLLKNTLLAYKKKYNI